ncbi:MAG TPA: cupin domain-containing protein [Terracidiphilus sp.]|nr:cupin domain-containing protein [Terracidiphilus sp.]
MTITRRDALAGLVALSAALTERPTAVADEPQQPILGPAVFHWDEMKFKPNAVGAQAPLCKQPTATLDQLEMHVSKLEPGKMSHPPHQHVNEELIILREGTCETLSNGQWVKVEAGSVVFNASNSLHGFRNIGTTTAVYHVINWSPNKEMGGKK